MEHFHQAIPGWFAAESEQLYRAAVGYFGDGARFVEIGAWKGRSAAFMAVEIANSGKAIEFTTVDHFRGSDEPPHRDDVHVLAGLLRDEFDRNVAPVAERIRVLQLHSVEAAMQFADGSLDFVFIDASHDEASVAADIAAWRPKLKPGGVIAGDDLDWPGVQMAVARAFGTGFWPVGRGWVVCPDQASRAAFAGFTGLLVATPCYDGVTTPYMLSLLRTQKGCFEKRLRSEIVVQSGASLITRARNTLAAYFLASDHSHLLFIDADIEWEPSAVLRLLRADKDVICGAYRKKKEPETYAVNFLPGSETQLRQCPISGAIEIMDAATGFLMIRRAALERMMAAYPERHYPGPNGLTEAQDRFVYDLFPTGIFEGRYLSEDYGFCHLWRQLGGQVWLDPAIKLNHHGQRVFEGDVARLFGAGPPAGETQQAAE